MSANNNLDILTLRRDVGEGTSSAGELAGVCVAELGQVGGDVCALVRGLREDVGETTGREVCGRLSDAGRGTDTGQAKEKSALAFRLQ